MENVAGEDLSWFWRGWFQYNWRFDQGINAIKYVKNDPARCNNTVEISKNAYAYYFGCKSKKVESRKRNCQLKFGRKLVVIQA
jgi:hypothetical protein